MTDRASKTEASKVSPSANDYFFELALFLLTSSRISIHEPRLYGPLRLVDGVSRLIDLIPLTPGLKEDRFLSEAKKEIDLKKLLVMTAPQQFQEFLDDMIRRFTQELKKRTPA